MHAASGLVNESLQALVDAVRIGTGADAVLVRLLVPEGGELAVRAVAASAPVAAELAGSRLACADVLTEETTGSDGLAEPISRLAERLRAEAVLVIPVHAGRLVGTLELYRGRVPFGAEERQLARLAAAELALVLRAPTARDGVAATTIAAEALQIAAEVAAGPAETDRTAERIAQLACAATGARAGLLWTAEEGGVPALVAAVGFADGAPADAGERGTRALRRREPFLLDRPAAGDESIVTVRLGEPALGVLQLHFARDHEPALPQLEELAALGGRVSHALRAATRARDVRLELDRTRALLGVVAQAIAELSLAHTLETAVERVAELLDVESVGIYLRGASGLAAAAGRALEGPHVAVAERLLELALGPFRARGMVAVVDAQDDRRLDRARTDAAGAGIEAAHAVPLVAHGDVIGLLAVYPRRGRALGSDESALLASLAAQLAVAVQNARLHEETKQLGAERERALGAERVAARRLAALYEISRSFAEQMSLDATLDAVASTLVELLDVDVAVIRLPDERGDALVAQALHVADPAIEPAMRAIFSAPESIARLPLRRFLGQGAVRVSTGTAQQLGAAHGLLVPFLEKGSTAVVLPIATPGEVLATLTLISLDPGRPITAETIDTAGSVAAQAALAVDNARLYQQQKHFADTMQRSLLPRTRPEIEGIDLGEAYESSARVDVGGDVYDFMAIGEQRLAVVLGDVTGHGIDAAADMAMAKFVFRSLARRNPEPGAFLAAANDVVVEEIEPGKFITMLYLTVDVGEGVVACASAGHPPPRLVHADGSVEELRASGLALGIDDTQEYEELRCALPVGAAVVVYTDGVIEARQGSEQYGYERLDALVSEGRHLPARELALRVLADCRHFAGGELRDDCAVVVVKRTP